MAVIVFLHTPARVTLAAMTTPRPRSARRPNAQYRWTRDKALAFLHALARGATVAEAARGVGMSRQSAYYLRARLGEGFAEVWDEGRALGAQVDTRVPAQVDTSRAQVDASGAQVDTLGRKLTPGRVHTPQVDTVLPQDRVNGVNPVSPCACSPLPTVRLSAPA
ncbi:hypothetical protein PMI02_05215 [Novosphingobium sp. AP12]|nr:hypothetical protein PMI02_05215 [Novosphingobium sp. AP12]